MATGKCTFSYQIHWAPASDHCTDQGVTGHYHQRAVYRFGACVHGIFVHIRLVKRHDNRLSRSWNDQKGFMGIEQIEEIIKTLFLSVSHLLIRTYFLPTIPAT